LTNDSCVVLEFFRSLTVSGSTNESLQFCANL
jgi:hypothetical protein